MSEPAKKFKALIRDIDLKQISVGGKDEFERTIRVTFEKGKLVSVIAVPNTIKKLEAQSDPEKK